MSKSRNKGKDNPMYGKTGEKCPGFKGGRVIRWDGSVRILMPAHKYADSQNYVYEHRLIMEKKIRRFLKPDEIVHHIDEDRSNNRIENLRLMTDSKHKAMHCLKHKRLGVTEEFLNEMIEDRIRKMEVECNLGDVLDLPRCKEMWAILEETNNRRYGAKRVNNIRREE